MSVDQAIADADAALPGEASDYGEDDPRWDAIVEVGRYSQSNPAEVWQFAARWGNHPQASLREAIASGVLEHLLEHHFELVFPQVEQQVAVDRYFSDTFSRSWKLGKSNLPENSRRFDALLAQVSGSPVVETKCILVRHTLFWMMAVVFIGPTLMQATFVLLAFLGMLGHSGGPLQHPPIHPGGRRGDCASCWPRLRSRRSVDALEGLENRLEGAAHLSWTTSGGDSAWSCA